MIYLELGNYYGAVMAVERDGKYYLQLENYDKTNEVEISEKLYKAIEVEFTESEENKMATTTLNESKRIYHFPQGDVVELENVTELIVSESGNHRLKTSDNKLHIVPTGWIHIEIHDESDWTL